MLCRGEAVLPEPVEGRGHLNKTQRFTIRDLNYNQSVASPVVDWSLFYKALFFSLFLSLFFQGRDLTGFL
ncbi:MAG: hypothetical protein ACPGWR_06550 [Ardenticatenaceae bacterium]